MISYLMYAPFSARSSTLATSGAGETTLPPALLLLSAANVASTTTPERALTCATE